MARLLSYTFVTGDPTYDSIREFLDDPDGVTWEDVRLQSLVDAFVEEFYTRNPIYDEMSIDPLNSLNKAAVYYVLMQCFIGHSDDESNSNKAAMYTQLYNEQMSKLTIMS